MTTISLITTTFNAADTIRSCLACVQAQKTVTPNGRQFIIEHIIIDGQSTDGTPEIVRQFEGNRVASIVSEPDAGIYDGMNKGIAQATGDIVAILNADDFYVGNDTLAQVVDTLEDNNVAACYGNVLYIDKDNLKNVLRVWRSEPYEKTRFRNGWMPPHPAFYVRRNVYQEHGVFRTDLGTAADYELMLRFLYGAGISCMYTPSVWVAMRAGGASNRSFASRLRANRMDRRAWQVNGIRPAPWLRFTKPLRKLGQFFGHGNAAPHPQVDLPLISASEHVHKPE